MSGYRSDRCECLATGLIDVSVWLGLEDVRSSYRSGRCECLATGLDRSECLATGLMM